MRTKVTKYIEDFNNPAEIPVVVFTKDASKLGLNKMKKHIRHISVAEPHNKMSTTKITAQAIRKTNLPTSVSLSSSPYGHFSCHNWGNRFNSKFNKRVKVFDLNSETDDSILFQHSQRVHEKTWEAVLDQKYSTMKHGDHVFY